MKARRSRSTQADRDRSKAWYAANKSEARAKQKAYRERNPRVAASLSRAWRHANPARSLFSGAKHRAKKRGIEFSLVLDDIVIPDRCPILGIRLMKGPLVRGAIAENAPSIDRIRNDVGYIKSNILVVSWRANRLKGDASLAEMQALAAFYAGLQIGADQCE